MNVVLIGMPGCGKSAVGRLLAAALNRPLVETDDLIVAAEGCSIPEIFARKGEDYFRDAEAQAVAQAAAQDGVIISTGGGAILREENRAALERHGVIFFLHRPPDALAAENHAGRPLLAADSRQVFALYTQRIELYRTYARYIISDTRTAEEAANRVLDLLTKEGD